MKVTRSTAWGDRPGYAPSMSRAIVALASILALLALLLISGLGHAAPAGAATRQADPSRQADRVVERFPATVAHSPHPRAALARDLLETATEQAALLRAAGGDPSELDLVVEHVGVPDDIEDILSADMLSGAAADLTPSAAAAAAATPGVILSGSLATVGDLTLDLSPLTAEEAAWFVDLLGRAYPVMAAVYGPPARPLTVTVWKLPSLPFAGLYSPAGNTLLVRELRHDVVVHELLHAFRDEAMSAIPAFEEGIVRAAEVLVLDRLGLDSWDSGFSYVYDRMYDAHNLTSLMSSSGAVLAGYAPMYLLRYQVAGMAWGQAEIAEPGFIKTFNSLYVPSALADPSLRSDLSAQRRIFGRVPGKIEGEGSADWAAMQQALTPTGGPGLQLHADVTDDTLTVRTYHRDAAGAETAAPATLTIEVTPAGASSATVSTVVTNGLGMAAHPLRSTSMGRVNVRVTAITAKGTVTRELQAFGSVGAGLFGIVAGDTQSATGTVTATIAGPGRGDDRYSARLVDGAFQIPALGDRMGTVTLKVALDGGEVSTFQATVVKGRGNTYVQLSGPTLRGPEPRPRPAKVSPLGARAIAASDADGRPVAQRPQALDRR